MNHVPNRHATDFFNSLLEAGGTPAALRRRFPDMDRLLRAMSAAFEDLAPNP